MNSIIPDHINGDKECMFHWFDHWNVPTDYAEPMVNYFLYGYHPGSFFYSILRNDFYSAIVHSHAANQIIPLKALVGCLMNHMPRDAFGSQTNIDSWFTMSNDDRRTILEKHGIIKSVFETLRDVA